MGSVREPVPQYGQSSVFHMGENGQNRAQDPNTSRSASRVYVERTINDPLMDSPNHALKLIQQD